MTPLMLRAGVFVALLSGLGCAAHAAHAADCTRQDLTTLELNQCADQDAKRADKELNAVYEALRHKIDTNSQVRLRDAQRAWITFRDKECVFQTGGGMNQEGTIWPMLVLKCNTDLTQSRVRALREQLKCPSWDLSCPAQ